MGHWYKKEDGTPMYEVPKSTGKGTRATTITDARKLGLVPSVTTILGQLAKAGLEQWKIGELLKIVARHPCPFGGDEKEWSNKIKILLQEETGKYAEIGNNIHDALEQYYTKGLMPRELADIGISVVEHLYKKFGNIKWISEAYFSNPIGYGGKCDLHIGRDILPDYPNGIVLDFKTKHSNFTKFKPYEEHCQQLVAYREGLNLPNAVCYNLYIAIETPGALLLHEWTEEECQKSWKMFNCLLSYWQQSNNFEV